MVPTSSSRRERCRARASWNDFIVANANVYHGSVPEASPSRRAGRERQAERRRTKKRATATTSRNTSGPGRAPRWPPPSEQPAEPAPWVASAVAWLPLALPGGVLLVG